MDDLIYGELKKNIIMPIKMVNVKGTTGGYEFQDLKLIADGTGKFFKTF